MLVAAVALAIVSASWLTPPRPPRDPTQLARLPARPADIAAHGGPERSELAPDVARRANDAVPFAPGPVIPARPFRFLGSDQDRARARECLAAAQLYEAGSDEEGQEAVAQVVLNRARHPAFPGTICGVVYQGAERETGCQFTFTCDGALARKIPEPFWVRARALADRALGGRVYRPVGWATHYHTQDVYPWWSPSLTKVARVGTHLFFGWPGSWGSPAAFARRYGGGEPDPAVLARRFIPPESAAAPELPPSPTSGAPPTGLPGYRGEYARKDLPVPPGFQPDLMHGTRLRLVHPDGGFFGLLVPAKSRPLDVVETARALCRAHGGPGGWCRVMGWAHETDIPAGFPVPPAARARLVFDYVQASGDAEPNVSYDCTYFPSARQNCR